MKRLLRVLWEILKSVVRIVINMFLFTYRVFSLKDDTKFRRLFLALVFEPVVIAISVVLCSDSLVEFVYWIIKEPNTLSYKDIIVLYLLVTVIFIANGLLEFIYRLATRNSEEFISFWEQQDRILNYYMGLISIMAIYVALNSKNADEINIMIMVWAILTLISQLTTSIYRKTFIDSKFVEQECARVLKIMEKQVSQ